MPTATQDTSVDRLLTVAVHKIASKYNLPDAHKLMYPSPQLVARLAVVYRKEAARLEDGGRYVFDAMLAASQYGLKLLQAARGTRTDLPGAVYWALLLSALTSVVMKASAVELTELDSYLGELIEELAQL